MDKSMFSFKLVDTKAPETVIKDSLKQIASATQGYVTGDIQEYDGPIRSYTKKVELTAAFAPFQATSETIKVNIQDDLGEQNNQKNRFEVFLTVKGLEHYKYRMMFIDYGSVSYPVTIVLNEMLAAAYSGRKIEMFRISSMKELEDMMDSIINSSEMILFLQNLINEALRRENENAADIQE